MTDEEIEKRATDYAEPLDITYGGRFNRTTEEVKQAFIAGYHKAEKENASKWHYPSKGELPKNYEGGTALLLAIKKEPSNRSVISETEIALGFYNGEFRKTGFLPNFVKNNDVIAWQYLPEPPKEEEQC